MKNIRKFTAFFFGISVYASANAITYTDVDVDGNEGEPHYQYLASWSFSTWSKTFNLLSSGFDPTTMEILSATVSFAFADDENDSWDYSKIVVGGEDLWNWQDVDGSHQYGYEWFTTSLSSDVISKLQDGVIDYSVEAQYGDFYLKEAKIDAEVGYLKVPDAGATLGMLGLGVATLLILRRQMSKGTDA
ncbi:VPDSG-CTERM sorting domain-containing protein [Pelagicoccus sp. SDUM812002]|uniref:VPDSG-CTERM sorting domain-containing protein n=1 Tax=Pelagicoccus sp. SDUM812002 TaxID=3041266 RepID=UPI00280E9314|nr:VPDSG-CTERM sorting domain-containing protein [Pelagicoccus sp. SDUM812002]MDQ8186032.1 VPDSG-CTERM sorting domain-containing protein [Pelagicoccus sp. SDUM812002]